VSEPDLYRRLGAAPPGGRKEVYEAVYDELYGEREKSAAPLWPPKPRRQRRISLYKEIIGRGHARILELGCGIGDLTYSLAGHAETVIGTDVSARAVEWARKRRRLWESRETLPGAVEFLQMDAVRLNFPDEFFNCVVSTSMIEHLYPDDVRPHLREAWRVLKPGGRYLVWCPNRLGAHRDRHVHFSMFSYRELIKEMERVGFRRFRSPLFAGPPLVSARFKVFLEGLLSTLRLRVLWSHLGVRNILLVATK